MRETTVNKTLKNRKIKIAFVSLFSNISGATLAMLEIIDKLIEDGNFDVIVITGSRGTLETRLEERNIPVFKCLFFSWLKGRGIVEEIKIRVKRVLSFRSEIQILNILKEIQEREGIAYLFISHDREVVSWFTDEKRELKGGRIYDISGGAGENR